MKINLDHSLNQVIKDWVASKYPQEACGLLIEEDGKLRFVPCENTAENPLTSFEIKLADVKPFIIDGSLKAVIHSHIMNKLDIASTPSKSDMESQLYLNVDFGIFDTDGEVVKDAYWFGEKILEDEIIGVEFQAGVSDCYTLIRKFFWQRHKINLPEYARDETWWNGEDDFYTQKFEEAGFVKISKEQLQDSDLVLGKIKSTKINHGGIYLNNNIDGKGLILHHLPKRLSSRESAYSWINRAELFLRHKNFVI